MEDVLDNFSHLSPLQYFGAIGLVIFVFLGIILMVIWRKAAANFSGKQSAAGGMHIYDVERMRKEGAITEEEYKTIKRKVAERALAETRQQRAIDEERQILEQAQYNPDAVLALLPEELRKKKLEGKPAGSEASPAEKAQDTAPAQSPAANEEILGDPLGGVSAEKGDPVQPPQPSMNMPRVAQAKRSELDELFEKGAISKEEYERLKGFFKKEA